MVGSSTEISELAAGEGEQLSNGFVWDKSSACCRGGHKGKSV